MLKKLTAITTILALLSGQAFASTKKLEIEIKLNNIATQVAEGTSKADLIESSKEVVDSAKENGIDKKEFVEIISEKLRLDLSEDEINETIADVEADNSEERVEELASMLTESADEQQLFSLTFVLLLFLLFFFP